MKNLAARTLTCVIGVPLVVLMLLSGLAPYLFGALSCIAVAIGSLEMSALLFGEKKKAAALLGAVPLFYIIEVHLLPSVPLFETVFVLLLLSLFSAEVFRAGEDFSPCLTACAKDALLCAYPLLLSVSLLKILFFESGYRPGSRYVLLLLVLVFSNDIFAYVFGRLFGGKSRGIVKVSPKKSVAGFVGGALTCIAVSILLSILFFEEFPFSDAVLMGLLISICADIGDLIESLFKRSAGVKDSGNVIPGRGGMLDCLDSILASAPVLLLLLEVLL